MYNLAGGTLFGYEYMMNKKEDSLFSDIKVPEEIETRVSYERQTIKLFDKKTLLDLIMEQCGDLITYRQNPLYLKTSITAFFEKNYNNFERMMLTNSIKFDPLLNYDKFTKGDSKIIDTSEKENQNTYAGKEIQTSIPDGKETTRTLVPNNNIVAKTENRLSSDNESGYSNDTEQIVSQYETGSELSFTSRTDTLEIDKHSLIETTTIKGKDNDSKNVKTVSDLHEFGNVGVQTTADIGLRTMEFSKFNVYEYVVDLFEREICISLY